MEERGESRRALALWQRIPGRGSSVSVGPRDGATARKEEVLPPTTWRYAPSFHRSIRGDAQRITPYFSQQGFSVLHNGARRSRLAPTSPSAALTGQRVRERTGQGWSPPSPHTLRWSSTTSVLSTGVTTPSVQHVSPQAKQTHWLKKKRRKK